MQHMKLHDLPVRQLAITLPGAIAVFKRHGLNFTSQGAMYLSEFLSQNSEETRAALLRDLDALAGPNVGEVETSDIIHHVLAPYHATQRSEFMNAILLSRSVERRYWDRQDCPLGLARALKALNEDLDLHQLAEEGGLFVQLAAGSRDDHRPAIRYMIHEHGDMVRQIDAVKKLAHNYIPPSDACVEWRDLYRACEKLDSDLRFHVALEDNQLFPRFTRHEAVGS